MATRSRLGGLRSYEVSGRCIADLEADLDLDRDLEADLDRDRDLDLDSSFDGDGTTVASNLSLLLAVSLGFSRRGANERPLRMHLN